MRSARHFDRTRSRDLRAAQTSVEKMLWESCAADGWAATNSCGTIEGFFADFVCREHRLVVEVDGATHSTDEELAYDARREQALDEAGFRILRFSNNEVFHNIDDVCDTILMALAAHPLSP